MSPLRNLASVSNVELQEFFDSFDDVLLDCDGVLFLLETPIEGATEAVQRLKNLGKRVQYVTNNCTRTRKNFTALLQRFGHELTDENVILPAVAVIDYLKSAGFNEKIFLISFNAVKSELEDAGFSIADKGPSDVEESAVALIKALKNDPDVGAVFVDFDVNTNYIKIQKALLYLRNPDVEFLTGGMDRVIPVGPSLHLMGPGHVHSSLQEMTGREPVTFGKPGQKLNAYVQKKYNLNPSRTLFVGDTFSDMEFANGGGYQKLMVLTGITKEDELFKSNNADLLPKFYLNSLGDLNGLLDELSKSNL